MNLHERLKYIRVRKGLLQKKVAEFIGIGNTALYVETKELTEEQKELIIKLIRNMKNKN